MNEIRHNLTRRTSREKRRRNVRTRRAVTKLAPISPRSRSSALTAARCSVCFTENSPAHSTCRLVAADASLRPISRSPYGRLRRRRDPAHRACPRTRARSAPSRGCRPAAAVRSTPRSRGAGSGAQRFIAASPLRAIRTDRISHGGAGRDGCRRSQPLLAAGAAGDERSDASRRAKPDAAGRHPRGRARDPPLVRQD